VSAPTLQPFSTVARMYHALMARAAVSTRVQLGAEAVRRGWVYDAGRAVQGALTDREALFPLCATAVTLPARNCAASVLTTMS
jgi:hypothetical protein